MTNKHDFKAIRDKHSLVEVAARYIDLTKKGREYVGPCPFHADKDPSLTIFRGRDGIEHFRCFPCGATGDVIDFVKEIESVDVGEAIARLEGEQLPMPNTRAPRALPVDETECWEPIVPVPADAPPYDPRRTYNPKRPTHDDGRVRFVHYRPALSTEWRTADGALIGHILRLEFADGEKICPVVTYCVGPGGERRWCAKRPPPPFPFVGVEELARHPGKPVMVVEGEKKRAAAAATAPAFVWLSLFGGSDGVRLMDVAPLVGRNVTLWPDADAPGRRAMRELGERLAGASPA